MNWRPSTERPDDRSVVVIVNFHWKENGWMSADINIGRAFHNRPGTGAFEKEPKGWSVQQDDSRGTGSELWEPKGFELSSTVETFTHWIPADELGDPPI